MAVFSVTGRVFKDPTSARVGGDYVKGITDTVAGSITWMVPSNTYLTRINPGADEGFEARHAEQIPPLLLIPMIDNGLVSRQLLYPHLTTSGEDMEPGHVDPHAKVRTFSLLVRPTLEKDIHIYAEHWALAQHQQQAAIYHEVIEMFAGNMLGLVPTKPQGYTKKPYVWGKPATIDAEYFGGGA